MKLNVLAKLACLAGKHDAGYNIQSLAEDEERFDTPYAYYGEFWNDRAGMKPKKSSLIFCLKTHCLPST